MTFYLMLHLTKSWYATILELNTYLYALNDEASLDQGNGFF